MTNRVKSAAPASRLKSRTALALHTWGQDGGYYSKLTTGSPLPLSRSLANVVSNERREWIMIRINTYRIRSHVFL